MIDVHCHLEQKEYDDDREKIVEKCINFGLKGIITCCAREEDFNLTMNMIKRWKNYIFATVGIHPEFVKDISEKDIDRFFELIKKNKKNIVAIGEIGLDYWWIKKRYWKEKQKELFIKFINFAKDMKKPIVVHSRDAYEDCIKILEMEDARDVLMHMFGANKMVENIVDNGWSISMNAIVLRSKKHKKVVRDIPLEKIMLETDSPWLHPSGKGRNDPTSIETIAKKIADIKRLPLNEVWKQCGINAINFFRLPIKL